MQQFLWRDSLIGVAKYVNACLDNVCAGFPEGRQASDQRGVAGRDVR